MNYDFPQVEMPLLYGVCHWGMATLHEMFFRGEVIGQENIPVTGPFILAVNHASHLDPPVAGGHVPREIAAFARKTLWKPGIPAWWLTKVGCIPVDRDGGSDVAAMKRVMQVLKGGKPLILFPEGTRAAEAEGGSGPHRLSHGRAGPAGAHFWLVRGARQRRFAALGCAGVDRVRPAVAAGGLRRSQCWEGALPGRRRAHHGRDR